VRVVIDYVSVMAAYAAITLLAKHWIWRPDDGFLCEPKYVEAGFIILTLLII
jgi:hypothetical protein